MTVADVDDLPTDDELRRVVRRAVLACGAAGISGLLLGAVLGTTADVGPGIAAFAAVGVVMLGVIVGTFPLALRCRDLGRLEIRVAGSQRRREELTGEVVRRTAIGLSDADVLTCTDLARVVRVRTVLAIPFQGLRWVTMILLLGVALAVGDDWVPLIFWPLIVLGSGMILLQSVREHRAARRFLAAIDELESRR